MKINGKPFPQWLNIAIGLIAISTTNVICKHLTHKETDRWKPFETVTRTASVNLLPDTAERRKWCNCVIATFRSKYPNGLNDLSQDTLNTQMALTSYNCIHEIRHPKK